MIRGLKITNKRYSAHHWQTDMVKINPYIAGNPVGGGEAFIGRADVYPSVDSSFS